MVISMMMGGGVSLLSWRDFLTKSLLKVLFFLSNLLKSVAGLDTGIMNLQAFHLLTLSLPDVSVTSQIMFIDSSLVYFVAF